MASYFKAGKRKRGSSSKTGKEKRRHPAPVARTPISEKDPRLQGVVLGYIRKPTIITPPRPLQAWLPTVPKRTRWSEKEMQIHVYWRKVKIVSCESGVQQECKIGMSGLSYCPPVKLRLPGIVLKLRIYYQPADDSLFGRVAGYGYQTGMLDNEIEATHHLILELEFSLADRRIQNCKHFRYSCDGQADIFISAVQFFKATQTRELIYVMQVSLPALSPTTTN